MDIKKKLSHASLFSGIGGFDLAAETVGWTNLFNCEINEFCNKVLMHHFPKARHYDNIKETDFTEWCGRVDVLSGGFPCQPFSLAGRRRGTDDDRHLWPEMLRAIDEIKPAWVVGENVAGILSMVQQGGAAKMVGGYDLFGESCAERVEERQRFVIDTVCEGFGNAGYSIIPLVIPACAVGAPHRRSRVWFIAHRDAADPKDGRGGVREVWRAETVPRGNAEGGCDGGFASDSRNNGDMLSQHERRAGLPARENTGSDDGNGVASATAESLPQDRWQGFPSVQPALRRGDDGLPAALDGISLPAWRRESLRAYGNAIVPQVAVEIFRAIQETYDKT